MSCRYPSNQDAQSGRDVTNNNDSDGHAGFSFTKISSTGAELPTSATQWSCVKDNITGLIWENKTDDGGLHDKDNLYAWYNPDSSTNGGHAGAVNVSNNTDAFVNDVNTATWCGASNWRLPSREELLSIINFSIGFPGPAIDVAYFPNTHPNVHWSSSTDANKGNSDTLNNNAWGIGFGNGDDTTNNKGANYAVRLVRSKQ